MNERSAEIIKRMNVLSREIKYNDSVIKQNGEDIDKMMTQSEAKIIENVLKQAEIMECMEELSIELSKG